MKNIISLLLIGSILFACKKGKADFTLKGKITDNTFGIGHAGATAILYEKEVGSNNIKQIGSAIIGNDGTYSFTFTRNKAESYTLLVTKNNYFDIEETILFSSLSIKDDNIRDYSTTAKAWVNLRFINQDPESNDQLRYMKQEGKKNCSECCTDGDQYLYGAVDTNIYCINNGNTNYSYYYWVLGTSVHGSNAVNTIPFDTTELLLFY
jgi:hypothetical protein